MSRYQIPEEANAEWQKANDLWSSGHYREALHLIKSLSRAWPENIRLRIKLAVLMGDYSQGMKGKASFQLRRAVARRLRTFLRGLPPKVDKTLNRTLRNEIFFQTRQFKKQYQLGIEVVRRGEKSGYFCVGVGAWAQAEIFRRKRKSKRSLLWANRACDAWEKLIEDKGAAYADIYGFYAMSLLAAGREKEALEQHSKASAMLKGMPSFEDYDPFDRMKLTFYRCIGVIKSGPFDELS